MRSSSARASPAQPSISPTDPLYNERLATQFTQYDPDAANAMLDKLLPEKDGDGYRLDSQGRRVSIIFELDQTRTTFLDMFQLAIPMFQAVGIDAQIRTMDRSLWETRVREGREFDATAHQFGANSGIAAMLDARYFVPFSANSLYAPGWSLYFQTPDHPNAIEPPADVKAQQELYKKLLATADAAQQQEVMAQILENAADQFLVWGVSLPPDGYGVVEERHGQHHAGDAELLRLADPGAVASRAVLQGLLVLPSGLAQRSRAGRTGSPDPPFVTSGTRTHARRQD